MIGRLVTKERGQRKSKRPKGKGKGHDIPKSKGMPTCWKSMKPWHIKKCCNSQEQEQMYEKNQKKVDDISTALVVSRECSDDDVVILVCAPKCNLLLASIMRVGCRFYCFTSPCSREKYFNLCGVGDQGSVKIDNSVANIVRKCDICIHANVDCIVIVKNVKHILNFSLNMITVRVLDKEGYKHELDDGI